MRIVAGKYKGRRIKTAKGEKIRPTTDRVREAIFNVLGNKIVNTRVLDLFSGTGSLGIEALSRGASHVTFIDKSPVSLRLVKINLDLIGEAEKARILRGDVFKVLKKLAGKTLPFDVVFADPPYKERFHEEVLLSLKSSKLLTPGAIIIYETASEFEFINFSNGFELLKSKVYGDTKVSFIVHK